MNRNFLYVGLVTLLLVTIAILTCPTEEDYNHYLETTEGIVCSGTDFNCVQNSSGAKLELQKTELHNRVFFMTIEKTFKDEKEEKVVMKAFGIFNLFFHTSSERLKQQ